MTEFCGTSASWSGGLLDCRGPVQPKPKRQGCDPKLSLKWPDAPIIRLTVNRGCHPIVHEPQHEHEQSVMFYTASGPRHSPAFCGSATSGAEGCELDARQRDSSADRFMPARGGFLGEARNIDQSAGSGPRAVKLTPVVCRRVSTGGKALASRGSARNSARSTRHNAFTFRSTAFS